MKTGNPEAKQNSDELASMRVEMIEREEHAVEMYDRAMAVARKAERSMWTRIMDVLLSLAFGMVLGAHCAAWLIEP